MQSNMEFPLNMTSVNHLIQPLECGSCKSSHHLLSKSLPASFVTDWKSSIALSTSVSPQRFWITSLAALNLPTCNIDI